MFSANCVKFPSLSSECAHYFCANCDGSGRFYTLCELGLEIWGWFNEVALRRAQPANGEMLRPTAVVPPRVACGETTGRLLYGAPPTKLRRLLHLPTFAKHRRYGLRNSDTRDAAIILVVVHT